MAGTASAEDPCNADWHRFRSLMQLQVGKENSQTGSAHTLKDVLVHAPGADGRSLLHAEHPASHSNSWATALQIYSALLPLHALMAFRYCPSPATGAVACRSGSPAMRTTLLPQRLEGGLMVAVIISSCCRCSLKRSSLACITGCIAAAGQLSVALSLALCSCALCTR